MFQISKLKSSPILNRYQVSKTQTNLTKKNKRIEKREDEEVISRQFDWFGEFSGDCGF